ncbi:MAG: hypothetical protein Ct9H90mP27_4020 [Gammaproteobacteria bacterium]|nr:MAG: hypothetical protein Ct9H90mP27_4020 [Gammaproteobacteria bacterium]
MFVNLRELDLRACYFFKGRQFLILGLKRRANSLRFNWEMTNEL